MTSAFRTIFIRNRRNLYYFYRCNGQSTSSTNVKFGVAAVAAALSLSFTGAKLSSCEEDDNRHHRDHTARAAALSRNFIADAAAVVAPTVVNIVAKTPGFLGTANAGSGFIISKDGYIVTNAHVVEAARVGGVVEVTMCNGRKFSGVVWGMDRGSDIALIKVDEKQAGGMLPTAIIGDSSVLRAGEFVVAVGSPLQLMNSVTFGIVSSPARHSSELGMGTKYSSHDFIQTDAAINVGNSGGPLVNLDGEVIGINAMKAQGMDGVSFAIPMDTAWAIITQLRSQPNVKVTRPYVGLRMVNFRPESAQRGSPEAIQVLITDIREGSPADKAGLRVHDIILSIDGKPVHDMKDVFRALGWEAGKCLRLQVRRGSAESGKSHWWGGGGTVTEEVVDLVTGKK